MLPKGNMWQHTIFVVGLLQLPFLQHWIWLERRHWHLPFPAVLVAHEGVSMWRFFIRGFVNKIVEVACATFATTKKQTHRKWSESEKDMTLHIAREKSSDSRALLFLASTFPKTVARMRESHTRDLWQISH